MNKSKGRCIREYCLECCLGSMLEVKECPVTFCPFWAFRKGVEVIENRSDPNRINRKRAIIKKCKECAGESDHCDVNDCPLKDYCKISK